MRVFHPIYGPGSVLTVAYGYFSYVKFDKDTNVSHPKGRNILAVSLKVCHQM